MAKSYCSYDAYKNQQRSSRLPHQNFTPFRFLTGLLMKHANFSYNFFTKILQLSAELEYGIPFQLTEKKGQSIKS